MAPACSSISLFPSAQTKNTRDGPTAAFPKDSILSRMGKPRIQPTISFVISFIPAWAGKLDAAHRQLGGDGPIPTHAGKTHSHSLPPITTLAHPRSRGENGPGDRACLTSSGSSPLTRGKRLADLRDGLNLRLIPAHAGKTSSRCSRKACIPAHPRSRGENHRLAAGIEDAGGSSPPSRGENTRYACHAACTPGSSPLTRGKPRRRTQPRHGNRLIPAHAGKTRGLPRKWPRFAAHPRSRGENMVSLVSGRAFSGSSPLTRGKLRAVLLQGLLKRLIPAHAGKTAPSPADADHNWAHPRSRGENVLRDLLVNQAQGSSPLTRGKRPCP